MKVKIKDKEYDFSFDSVWGPIYTYEEIAGSRLPFDPRKTMCMHILFYCILLKANKDFTLELEDFMKALDDMSLATSMNKYYNDRMAVLTIGDHEDQEKVEGDNKKKD